MKLTKTLSTDRLMAVDVVTGVPNMLAHVVGQLPEGFTVVATLAVGIKADGSGLDVCVSMSTDASLGKEGLRLVIETIRGRLVDLEGAVLEPKVRQ